MRYISTNFRLVLSERGGSPRHIFRSGVLDLGTGVEINATPNASDPELSLILPYDTDLSSGTTDYLERAGMGTLNKEKQTGSTTYVEDGWAEGRFFFEAPKIANGDAAIAGGVTYIVLSGTVTYDGTAYTAGHKFITDASTTATTATVAGFYALAIPEVLASTCETFTAEQFKIKHLMKGDEPYDYWLLTGGGFEPKDSYTPSDDDSYGWQRETV